MRRLGAEPSFGSHSFPELISFTTQTIIKTRFAHAQGLFCSLAAPRFGLELAAELPRVVRDASLLGGGLPVVVDLDEPARELALRS